MNDTATFKALAGSAGFDFKAVLAPVEQRLEDVVGPRAELVRDPSLVTLRAGGKRLRPLLVLMCGGALGASPDAQQAAPPQLVSAAAAVELVHMATLVHDDVLDDAPQRRGRPTVYATNGRELATSVGDLLFALAFDEISGTGDQRLVAALSHATEGLARGELLQREDAWNAGVARERYELRCELKTARLFEAATQLGSFAGRRDALAAPMREFGRRVGLAFQMADDVLDVVGDPAVTGKPRGADLLDGTVNLPLIVARERDPELAGLDLRAVRTPADAAAICDRIAATGATDDVLRSARASVDAAKHDLLGLLPEGERPVFELIADQSVGRSL